MGAERICQKKGDPDTDTPCRIRVGTGAAAGAELMICLGASAGATSQAERAKNHPLPRSISDAGSGVSWNTTGPHVPGVPTQLSSSNEPTPVLELWPRPARMSRRSRTVR
jgi:hypothetical protein